jgi:hypothetical protein
VEAVRTSGATAFDVTPENLAQLRTRIPDGFTEQK